MVSMKYYIAAQCIRKQYTPIWKTIQGVLHNEVSDITPPSMAIIKKVDTDKHV